MDYVKYYSDGSNNADRSGGKGGGRKSGSFFDSVVEQNAANGKFWNVDL